MPLRKQLKAGALLLALVLTTAFTQWHASTAQAAPAFGNGVIAYGDGSDSWTVVNADGSNKHTVTAGGLHHIRDVSYSPNGRWVAFSAMLMWKYTGIWIASADGTNARLITSEALPQQIAWSPDGSNLIFNTGSVIESMPADGSSPPTQLFAPSPGCYDRSPQVSTRGYVYFTRFCQETFHTSLAVYRPGDRQPLIAVDRPATPGNPFATIGVVSPDGSHLLQQQGDRLVVTQIGGGDRSYTVAVSPNVSQPTFGPSGDIGYLDWTSSDDTGTFRLMTAAPSTGGKPRIVTEDRGPISFLTWANGPANFPARPVAERVGGTDRIDTSVAASRWAFDASGPYGRQAATAVLARSDLYPDALAGTALAIQKDGPLLLTPSNGLSPAVSAELSRVLAPGSTVYLLGGTTALNPAVADAVQHLGFVPRRLGGADRFATAVAIATAISGTNPASVLLATGDNYPDALTAAAAAGQERYDLHGTTTPAGGVVLLTDGTVMPAATRAYLNQSAPAAAWYAVGGPAATALDHAYPGRPRVTRLAGIDRYDTAAKVATSALFGNGAPYRYRTAAIATGLNFPDAMSGGALIGREDGPLLLSGADGLTPQETAILQDQHVSDIVFIGGTAVVPAKVLTATADAVFGPNTWITATNRTAPPLP